MGTSLFTQTASLPPGGYYAIIACNGLFIPARIAAPFSRGEWQPLLRASDLEPVTCVTYEEARRMCWLHNWRTEHMTDILAEQQPKRSALSKIADVGEIIARAFGDPYEPTEPIE